MSLLLTVEKEIPKETASNEKYAVVIDKLRVHLYIDVFKTTCTYMYLYK
jgi:hypothetical protein